MMMKRSLLMISLFFILFINMVFCDISTSTVKPGEYPEKNILKINEQVTLQWKILKQKKTIEFAMVGKKIKGWMNIGFINTNNPSDEISHWIAYMKNGKLQVENKHNPTTTKGKTVNHVLGFNGDLTEKQFIIKFKRKLDTGEFGKIIQGEPMSLAISYNHENSDPTTSHSFKTIETNIDLFAEESVHVTAAGNTTKPTQKPPAKLFTIPNYVQYTVLATVIIVTCFLGFIMRWLHTCPPVDFILHYPMGLVIAADNFLTNAFNDIVRMKVSDLYLIVGYCSLFVVWGATKAFASVASHPGIDNSQLSGKIFGELTMLNLAFILLPISRNNILTLIFGISFERLVTYHRWMGRITWLSMMTHGISMTIHAKWGIFSTSHAWGYIICGFLAGLTFTLLAVLSFEPVRRNLWELFHFFHWFLALLGIFLVCLHQYGFYKYILAALGLWVLDLIIRGIMFLIPTEIVDCEAIPSPEDPSSGITQLTLHKPLFKWRGGQYVFIWIPKVSLLQVHPFSISCGSSGAKLDKIEDDDDEEKKSTEIETSLLGKKGSKKKLFTLHIKAQPGTCGLNSWTRNLYNMVDFGRINSKSVIRIEGGYGSLSVRYEQYKVAHLICGGIGVTPMISLLMDMSDKLHKMKNLKTVYFTWCVKHKSAAKPFKKIFRDILNISEENNIHISIHATRKKEGLLEDKEEEEDKVKGLTYSSGRPSIHRCLAKMEKQNPDTNKFAVYVCGPKELVKSTHNACYVKSLGCHKQFHLHHETFEL